MLSKNASMLIFCMALATAGLGQQNDKPGKKAATPAPETAYKPLDNTLLWKISGNGLKRSSYLFGTMHVLCTDDATVSDSLKLAIRYSEQIYFELDMDNMGEMLGAMKFLRMNDGQKLSELLTKEEYAKVEAYFKSHSVPLPLTMMNRFKPYFIRSLIGEQMMSCSKTNGMEELIMRESRQYNKEIKGLETTEFQASIFDSIPYQRQAKDLVSYIDSIDSYKDETMELVEVYREQNLERMDSLMRKSEPGMEDDLDILLYGRNRHWVEQMPVIMKDRCILFAVGAGHLPGEKGVINLLRKKGYKVTPMGNVNRKSESM